jgi:CheY-like chemotaxis protein
MSKKAFGTYEIANICDVTPSTVGNWIEKGLIPTFTTGGGHRRVWTDDLVKFLHAHNIPIPDALKNIENPKILIVDDEEHIRKLISRSLKKTYPDVEIHEAADGFEAGQKLATIVPFLVLLDLKLPGMDGFKVCELIRNSTKLKSVKVLAISGHNTEEYRARSLASGADDFLGKPFSVLELMEKITKLTGFRKTP